MRAILEALSRDRPAGRADLSRSLVQVTRRVPRGTRFLLVSDLLTRADPGVIHGIAGRGIRGALVHVRVPEINAPAPGSAFRAHDVESGEVRTLALDPASAARIAARATQHADLWAHHARMAGLLYLPIAPSFSWEGLLRRLVLEIP